MSRYVAFTAAAGGDVLIEVSDREAGDSESGVEKAGLRSGAAKGAVARGEIGNIAVAKASGEANFRVRLVWRPETA